MPTYSYRLTKPSVQETIAGVVFQAGVNQSYTYDNFALNEWVPDLLDRYVDGVKANTDLVVPISTPTQQSIYHHSMLRDSASGVISVTSNITVTPQNQYQYNGKTLVFSAAYSITLSSGLVAFSLIAEPPASGLATIIASGVTLNGAATTLTRATGVSFAIYPLGTDAYRVTGE